MRMSEEDDAEATEGKFTERVFDIADNIYRNARERVLRRQGCLLDPLKVASYEDLRKAFLPKRKARDVTSVGDQLYQTGLALVENGSMKDYNTPPSCKAVGLSRSWDEEDIITETCNISGSGRNGEATLECDCPDGLGSYTAEEYAKTMVRCIDGKAEIVYSDYPSAGLFEGLRNYASARNGNDVSKMVLALDKIVNAVHGSGPLANYFVSGGTETLDRLKNE